MMRNVLMTRGLKGCAVLAVAGVSLLAGCASEGVMAPKVGLTDSFSVNTDVNSAYRRAIEYVRVCHKSRQHQYGATYDAIRDSDQDTDDSMFGLFSTQRATEERAPKDQGRLRVFKVGEEATIVQLFEAKVESTAPVVTRMTIRVLGKGIWDQAELDAARKSIQTATPVCRPLG